MNSFPPLSSWALQVIESAVVEKVSSMMRNFIGLFTILHLATCKHKGELMPWQKLKKEMIW